MGKHIKQPPYWIRGGVRNVPKMHVRMSEEEVGDSLNPGVNVPSPIGLE